MLKTSFDQGLKAAFDRFKMAAPNLEGLQTSLSNLMHNPTAIRALLGGGAGAAVGGLAAPEGHGLQGALAGGAIGAGLGGLSGQIEKGLGSAAAAGSGPGALRVSNPFTGGHEWAGEARHAAWRR